MITIDKNLTKANGNWSDKIADLEHLLDQVRPQLIEAEAELADRLAIISAFEFKLRSRIEPLTRRLENLETEIQKIRKELLRLQVDQALANNDDIPTQWAGLEGWEFDQDAATSSGDFRYHEVPTDPPPEFVNKNNAATLKQLYRQLARRFHPDLALDDGDRAYRTGIMKAINAAYATRDINRLKELAREPDSANRIEYARTDQQLVQALYLELNRCRRRLIEINGELARLEEHQSSRLFRRAQRAEAQGRDLLAEISADLEAEIAHKMVERDVLKGQIETFGQEEADYHGQAFADAVLDLSYEGVFDDDTSTATARWDEPATWDGDILDDND